MVQVRTRLGGLVALAVLVGVAVLWLDTGSSLGPHEDDRDDDRVVTLRVRVDPARRVTIRWRMGGHGDVLVSRASTWQYTESAPKGTVVVLEVTQLVSGRQVECQIDVNGVKQRFHRRLGDGTCNVAHLVGAERNI